MVENFIISTASVDDMQSVFNLSNDRLVRKNSFNQEKINWENHKKWFKEKLNDKNIIFLLIKDTENNLVSQIRLKKINKDEGDISISLSPQFRGKGYGVTNLKLATEKIITKYKIKKINAYIKNENVTSQIIFKRANYILKEKFKDKSRYEYNAKQVSA